ncbi:MAG: nucleotidyltransferase family protein [Bacteroidota bacterium]
MEDRQALDATIALAKANGLYFPFMKWLIGLVGRVPPQEEKQWASELQSMSEFRNTIGILNAISDRAGIDYIIIKNSSIIEHVPRDVDILVRERDRDQFLELLMAYGQKLIYNDRSEILLAKSGLMKIDVYTRIHYLGRDFLDERFLWESRVNSSTHGMTHPGLSPETAYLLNLIHGLLGHGGITLLDFLDLSGLEKRIPNLAMCRAQAVASGWAKVFDLWTSRLQTLQRRIYEQRLCVKFPIRHGRRFILKCVSALGGHPSRRRERLVLGLSLFWDDLVFLSENSGVASILRRSEVATGVANSIGHRLRSLRGDRKSLNPVSQGSQRDMIRRPSR